MKKVIVIGSPGVGKSVFSRKLSEATGLPLFHLDMFYHKSDKTVVTREEFDRKLAEIMTRDEWILDGNYQRTMAWRMEMCDTVILLDYPTEVCLEGIKARVGEKREDFPWVDGEVNEMLWQKAKNFAVEKLPRTYELLEQYRGSREIVIFRSREEAEAYLDIY